MGLGRGGEVQTESRSKVAGKQYGPQPGWNLVPGQDCALLRVSFEHRRGSGSTLRWPRGRKGQANPALQRMLRRPLKSLGILTPPFPAGQAGLSRSRLRVNGKVCMPRFLLSQEPPTASPPRLTAAPWCCLSLPQPSDTGTCLSRSPPVPTS